MWPDDYYFLYLLRIKIVFQTISESQDQAEKEDLESKRIDQERKEREKQKAVKRKARKIKQKLLAGLVLR